MTTEVFMTGIGNVPGLIHLVAISGAIATTIPPNKDREPAILATLVPGNYTAIVRGKNNTTGIGLVEAYNLQ